MYGRFQCNAFTLAHILVHCSLDKKYSIFLSSMCFNRAKIFVQYQEFSGFEYHQDAVLDLHAIYLASSIHWGLPRPFSAEICIRSFGNQGFHHLNDRKVLQVHKRSIMYPGVYLQSICCYLTGGPGQVLAFQGLTINHLGGAWCGFPRMIFFLATLRTFFLFSDSL